jgi:hypothetical protein
MTEWFPHAARTDHRLVWDDIKVVPKEEVRLLSEKKESRYYAAREVDAAPLRVSFFADNKTTTEPEKFLFYRGVGNFEMPLSVRALGDGKFNVFWKGKAPKDDLILVRVQGGKVRFASFRLDHEGSLGATGDVQVPDKDLTTEKLGDALVKFLTGKGLYEKEARAMVKTWSSAWFGEEGTRVLYVLPDALTEDFLPLKVEPKPNSQLRVLVGRHDVLTPEREKTIDAWVKEINRPTKEQDAAQKAAWAELNKLGRYNGAAQAAAEARLRKRG